MQVRSLNKARDIREQLEGLCERVEVEISSNPTEMEGIAKVGFVSASRVLPKEGLPSCGALPGEGFVS